MKINFVLNTYPKPSETFINSLILELINRNYKIKLIILSSESQEVYYNHFNIDINFIKSHVILAPFKSSILLFNFLIKNLFRFISHTYKFKYLNFKKLILDFIRDTLLFKNKPDIVHFIYSGIATDFIDVLKRNDNNSKIFVSCRGSAEIFKPILEPFRIELLKKLWHKVDFVHCVSQDMLNRMIKLDLIESKAFINYPSVDIDKFVFLDRNDNHFESLNNTFIIVSTGRLDQQKGYIYALQAITLLINKGYKVEYHIMGDGPEYGPLKYYIIDNNLESFVFLHGKVNAARVKEVLSNAHIFLLSSVYEGISNAALEAMASGVPIVTTNAGGMNEVIKDRINGCLIPRHNPFAIFESIEYLINNYNCAVLFSQKARETVEANFNLKAQIDIFDEKYNLAVSV
jgi:colanic acid/amylovoran biosynthesis glycosyltransferase